jgi:hypothetical protein
MPSRYAVSVAAGILLPLQAFAAETLWTEVTVRIYDATGATDEDRRTSLDIARSIVSAASVELIWRTCNDAAATHGGSTLGRSKNFCELPLAPGELAVRLIRSGTVETSGRELPLGDALINTATGGGVLATIYIDRVDWLAGQTGVDRRALLGRAIAHELGHLLMATSTHAANGLMRPVWSQSEIRRRRKNDWTFRPGDIAAIKERTAVLMRPD